MAKYKRARDLSLDTRAKTLKARSPANPKLSAQMLLRARQQQALQMLASGHTPDQIAMELDCRLLDIKNDITKATDRFVSLFACSPQHTFVRYAVFQLGIIKKLQATVERFEADERTVQYNAVISALRAQSDAYDRILDKGINFGVIEQRSATKAIRQAPSDIRNMLKHEILTLSRLLDEVDLSIEFKTARARLHARKQEEAIQIASTFTVIIRKPLVGPHGIIRAVPDWKYRRKLYTKRADGKYTAAPSRATPEQLELKRLHEEISRLTTLIPQNENKQSPKQLPPAVIEVPAEQSPSNQEWLVSPKRT